MKDPENFGGAESSVEGLDDMIVGAGNDPTQLKSLLQFFEEMYEIAKPFADKATGKITIPGGLIPVDTLSPGLRAKIDAIDKVYVDTMRYTEWMNVFVDGHRRIKKKLEQQALRINNGLR